MWKNTRQWMQKLVALCTDGKKDHIDTKSWKRLIFTFIFGMHYIHEYICFKFMITLDWILPHVIP